MHVRAQGTFEYVLLLGGVLLTVVVALVVLQGSFQQSATGLSDVQLKQCKVSAQQAPSCFSGSAFQGGNTFSSLSVPE
ncbi:class III signal peptide-containing protein, partial [Candidatus Micrarchaeota archaeon]|nr:class III signal peptide-containing protein [Candidatus Micrarchaeota archaeon]